MSFSRDESSEVDPTAAAGNLVRLLRTLRWVDLEIRTLERSVTTPEHPPLAAQLADLIEQRALACAALPFDIKTQYQRLLPRRPGPIAALRHGHCSGCQLRIPAQLLLEAAKGTGHLPCPHCQRIVIASELEAGHAHGA